MDELGPYGQWVLSQYPKAMPAHGIRKGHTIDGKTVKHRWERQSAMDGYFVDVTFADGTSASYGTGETITVGFDPAWIGKF